MAITNGYATLPEVKAELRLTTTVDDARIERAIEAASRAIDNATLRRFYTTSGEQRIFRSWGATALVDDAQSVTLVEESTDQVSWATVAAAAYARGVHDASRLQLERRRPAAAVAALFLSFAGGVAAAPPVYALLAGWSA